MAKLFSRTRRVNEQIKRVLAVLIQQELADPRLGMVTISEVEVSTDLMSAKVFVTVLNDDLDKKESIKLLNKAANHLRHELGKHLTTRVTPSLYFKYDESIEHGLAMDKLISTAIETLSDDSKDHDGSDLDGADQKSIKE